MNYISSMNEKETVAHLKNRTKPYVGIMAQSSFSNTLTRWEAGLLKPRTLEKFLNKFGYVKTGDTWQKTTS